MALDIHTLGPWTAGLILSHPQEAIPHNALSLCENCEIGPAGEVRQRLGYDIYNTVIDNTAAVTLLGEHRFSASASRKYAIVNTKFWEDASGTWTDRTGAATITSATLNYWSAVSCFGTLFLCSSTNGQYKWSAAGGNLAAAGVSSRFTAAKMNEYFDSVLWYGSTSGGGDESYVWRTDSASFETIGVNNYHLTDGPLTGLKSFGASLMLHNKKGIWSLSPTGNTSIPYSRQPRCSFGSDAWRSVVTATNNQQYFVREEGVYEWDGGTDPVRISAPLDGSKYWDNLNNSYIQYSYAMVYPYKSWIIFAFPYGSVQTTMNHWMIFDYKYRRWFGPYKDFTRNCGAVIGNYPYAGSYNGRVYTHESGNDDDGASIDFDIKTSAMPPKAYTLLHRWISARHVFNRQSASVSVTVTQSSEGVVDKTDTISVVADEDAIQTEFTIGTSAIAGTSESIPIDTEMHGWDSGTSFEYVHNQLAVPVTLQKVECLYETIEGTPLNKFESGVR